MLGGLVLANLRSPARRRDFESLRARVGFAVTDIDEAVTLDFDAGRVRVSNGLGPNRELTIRTDADTVMSLSNLSIGPFGLPVYFDSVGRGVVFKLLSGGLKIEGLATHLRTLNRVTRIFSVR